MKCEKCKRWVEHSDSLNVGDKRLCVACAYHSFSEGAPARTQLERHYEEVRE